MKAERTAINSNSKPLRCMLLLCIAALWAVPANANGIQSVYVSSIAGTVGEYNAANGSTVKASFITGLSQPYGLALSGNILYVANYTGTTVGEYNANIGAVINFSFINTGLDNPVALAVSDNNLYVANWGSGTVGKYNATTGAAVNPNFITGLTEPRALLVSGNTLFVSSWNAIVGEYNASNGSPINSSLITGVTGPTGLALSGNHLFVSSYYNSNVGEYDASTGAVINPDFITSLSNPQGLSLSFNNLYVVNNNGTVGEYNAATGAAIDASLITGLSQSIGVLVGPYPPCTLNDSLSYNASTDTLTMKFTIGNQETSPTTWNAWLTYQDTMESLFSVSQPVTNPPKAIGKKKTGLSAEGAVGVLSTLTTAPQGIVCSNWVQTNTGTP